MMADVQIHVDFRKSKMTMNEVVSTIKSIQAEHPEREVWMDGDTYCLLSGLRV